MPFLSSSLPRVWLYFVCLFCLRLCFLFLLPVFVYPFLAMTLFADCFFSQVFSHRNLICLLSPFLFISERIPCGVWVDFVYRVARAEFVVVHLMGDKQKQTTSTITYFMLDTRLRYSSAAHGCWTMNFTRLNLSPSTCAKGRTIPCIQVLRCI